MDKNNMKNTKNYPLTEEQKKILDAIINKKNNINYDNLKSFDINLFRAIEGQIDLSSYNVEYNIPYIMDCTNKLLPCNIEYLLSLFKYTFYFNDIIKKWNIYIEDIDYSFLNKYIDYIININTDLAIKVLKQTPYIIYDCTNYNKDFAKKCILFIPTIFKYMMKYREDIDIASLAVNMDINNIKFVSKKIIKEMIVLYE